MARPSVLRSHLLRLLAVALVMVLALQLTFALKVAGMSWVNPSSTAFARSEAFRLLHTEAGLRWDWQWTDYSLISSSLKRAVLASEDAGFVDHSGVEWDAIEKAWEKNQAARPATASSRGREPRWVGGSTVTQQLAKNLFLSGERTVLRKSQELLIAFMLETFLSKQRILEIYLNHVEWAEGVFGAQAAARHYFRTDAARLGPEASARLAVMLPAPKRFEKRPNSPYLARRTQTVLARMGAVELP